MSWWEQVSGEVLGDGPADRVRTAFADVARRREETGAPLPGPDDLVAALEVAIQRGLDLLEKPRLVARLGGGARVTSHERPPGPLVDGLTAALEGARTDYRSAWDRDPSAAELASTVAFVLAPVADRVLDLPEGATGLEAIGPA